MESYGKACFKNISWDHTNSIEGMALALHADYEGLILKICTCFFSNLKL